MTTDYKERIRKVAAALLRRKAIPAERTPKREGKCSAEFVETVFTYDGHWTPGAKCGLQIFPGTGGIPVVVLTELPDNVNTSVTNLIECIAAEVVEQYIPARIGSRPPFHCVEHCYPTESIPDETFDLVAFEFDTPQRQVGDDYGIRVSPEAIICLAGEGRLTLGSPRLETDRASRARSHDWPGLPGTSRLEISLAGCPGVKGPGVTLTSVSSARCALPFLKDDWRWCSAAAFHLLEPSSLFPKSKSPAAARVVRKGALLVSKSQPFSFPGLSD
jgi:hypothetical protein